MANKKIEVKLSELQKIDIELLTEDELDQLQKQIIDKKEQIKKIRIKKEQEEVFNKLTKINENPAIRQWLLDSIKHSCASCLEDDSYTENGIYHEVKNNKPNYRCAKCALIDLLNQQSWDSHHSFEFNFDINVNLYLIDGN